MYCMVLLYTPMKSCQWSHHPYSTSIPPMGPTAVDPRNSTRAFVGEINSEILVLSHVLLHGFNVPIYGYPLVICYIAIENDHL